MLAINGMSYPTRCHASVSNSTPMCLAIAVIWICAFVEPPIAELTTIAFSNAFLVITCDGVKSSFTNSTIRKPVLYAICPRSL